MLTAKYLELINFFTLLVWILNGFIVALLLLGLGCAVWLCYAESRRPKSNK